MCDKMGVDRKGAPALRAVKDYKRFQEQLKAYSEFTKHKTLSIGASGTTFRSPSSQRIFGKRGSSVRSKVENSQTPSRARRT